MDLTGAIITTYLMLGLIVAAIFIVRFLYAKFVLKPELKVPDRVLLASAIAAYLAAEEEALRMPRLASAWRLASRLELTRVEAARLNLTASTWGWAGRLNLMSKEVK